MVQDQLHLRLGQGPRRADQRGGDVQRHPLQRHMGPRQRAPQGGFDRPGGGAAAVLAEHAGPVREPHPLRHGGRHLRQRHCGGGAGVPAALRPDCGRHRRAGHMDRAVQPVPQHPVRQRHPQRLPRHCPAPRQQRPERPAGAVLAQDRADGLPEPQQCDGGRHLRPGHDGSGTAVPDLLRPRQ